MTRMKKPKLAMSWKRPGDKTRKRIRNGGFPKNDEIWKWWALRMLNGANISRAPLPLVAIQWLEKVYKVKAAVIAPDKRSQEIYTMLTAPIAPNADCIDQGSEMEDSAVQQPEKGSEQDASRTSDLLTSTRAGKMPMVPTTSAPDTTSLAIWEELDPAAQEMEWNKLRTNHEDIATADLKIFVGRHSSKSIKAAEAEHLADMAKHWQFLKAWDDAAYGVNPERLQDLDLLSGSISSESIRDYVNQIVDGEKQGAVCLDIDGLRSVNVALADWLYWDNRVDRGLWLRRDATTCAQSDYVYNLIAALHQRVTHSRPLSVEFVVANFDGLSLSAATPAHLHSKFPKLSFTQSMIFNEEQERKLLEYTTKEDTQGLKGFVDFLERCTRGTFSLSCNLRALDLVQSGKEFPGIKEWLKHRSILCFQRLGAVDNLRRSHDHSFTEKTKFTQTRLGFPRGRYWGDGSSTAMMLPLHQAPTPSSRPQTDSWGLIYTRCTSPFAGLTLTDLYSSNRVWETLLDYIPKQLRCAKADCPYMVVTIDFCAVQGSPTKTSRPRQVTGKARKLMIEAGISPVDCRGCDERRRRLHELKQPPEPPCDHRIAGCQNCKAAQAQCRFQVKQMDANRKYQLVDLKPAAGAAATG